MPRNRRIGFFLSAMFLIVAVFAAPVFAQETARRRADLSDMGAYTNCVKDDECVAISSGCPTCVRYDAAVNRQFRTLDFEQCSPKQAKHRTVVECASLTLPKATCQHGHCTLARAAVEAPIPVPEAPHDGCFVGGCSSELCTEHSDGGSMSTCEMRPEYACYKRAECTRQPDGKCGWTQDDALKACLSHPPTMAQ